MEEEESEGGFRVCQPSLSTYELCTVCEEEGVCFCVCGQYFTGTCCMHIKSTASNQQMHMNGCNQSRRYCRYWHPDTLHPCVNALRVKSPFFNLCALPLLLLSLLYPGSQEVRYSDSHCLYSSGFTQELPRFFPWLRGN